MMAEKLLFYWTEDRAGRHAQTLFYAIAGPNADEKTFHETIALFDAKFERKPNLLYERSLFSAMRQQKRGICCPI